MSFYESPEIVELGDATNLTLGVAGKDDDGACCRLNASEVELV